MHVRWSAVTGMQVLDDETQECVGLLTDPLIDPDSGRILGFFVQTLTGFSMQRQFLATVDILSVGTKVHIRTADVLSPPDELIRLRKHLDDPRSFLGQKIFVKESRRSFGRCADLQFDTRHFLVEWIFPRRLFFFGQPVAAGDILEVTEEAIWVEDPLREKKEKIREQKETIGSMIPDVAPSM